MNTLMNTLCNCIKLSGYGKDDDDGNKEMSHVNLFSKSHENKAILFLESQVSKKLTISDSVLLASDNRNLVQFDSGRGFTLDLINCFIPSGFDYSQNDHVITNDCSTSNYDENKLVLFPHYTRGEQCQGKFNKNEPTAAHNCALGD